jgi:hypothetical protein
MAKDKLIVEWHCDAYRVLWWIGETDEEGAVLGEDKATLTEKEPVDPDEWENWKANKAANELEPERDSMGFWWETESTAKKALKYIKLALKQSDHPMPDWTKEALKAGWKPPKGWKA